MKKLFLLFSAIALTASLFAGNDYKISDAAIDELFEQAKEVSMVSSELNALSFITAPAPEITRGGYLIRAFCCGGIGLHRSYMGTKGKTLWYMYFCIPVWGGVVALVDFWSVVFDDKQLDKYKDNDKFCVWCD